MSREMDARTFELLSDKRILFAALGAAVLQRGREWIIGKARR